MGEFRIEVGAKGPQTDFAGKAVLDQIREDLGIMGLDRVLVVDVFRISGGFSRDQIFSLSKSLFVDPIVQDFSVDAPLFGGFDFCVEVSFLAGVTDNLGITARRGTEDFFGRKLSDSEGVSTSRQYLFFGKITRQQAEEIALKQLSNPLIQQAKILGKGK